MALRHYVTIGDKRTEVALSAIDHVLECDGCKRTAEHDDYVTINGTIFGDTAPPQHMEITMHKHCLEVLPQLVRDIISPEPPF